MWRVILIVVSVVVLDVLLMFVCAFATVDLHMIQISRALRAESDAPTPENHRVVEEAFETASILRAKTMVGFGAAILVLTSGGFFIAGRRFERQRGHQPSLTLRDETPST